MLLEFTVSNHLSILEPITLDLSASGSVSEFRNENTFEYAGHSLLKSAVMYGANASGKSNILGSMLWMRRFIIDSHKETQAGESLDIIPFKLDRESLSRPSHFEILFIQEGVRYRYGFEVDSQRIRKEWLFRKKLSIKEVQLFIRLDDEIEVSEGFAEGRKFVENTRDNALFLSTVAGLNGKLSISLMSWFQHMVPIHGLKPSLYHQASLDFLQDTDRREKIMDILKKADFGISDLRLETSDFSPPRELLDMLSPQGQKTVMRDYASAKNSRIYSLHERREPDGTFESVEFDFFQEESNGTRKFFSLIGPVLTCLEEGRLLVADELEAELHPLLTRQIIRLFHSPATNPKNAQLVFATHDANLLQYVNFRRDQIWFAEKNRVQATELYALSEIKLSKSQSKVRKDASYEKDYFQGRYGGVPFLGDFEKLMQRGWDANG